MFKKVIKYEDFEGNQKEKTCWFNLTKTELMRLRFSVRGGLDKTIEQARKEQDEPVLMAVFEEIVSKAYGERPEGNDEEFIKNATILEKFINSAAYDALIMELLNDADSCAEFMNKVTPTFDNKEKAIAEAMASVK